MESPAELDGHIYFFSTLFVYVLCPASFDNEVQYKQIYTQAT